MLTAPTTKTRSASTPSSEERGAPSQSIAWYTLSLDEAFERLSDVAPQNGITSIALLRQQDEYQDLAFNVWHVLTAHRPLGGINRVRRQVYPVSSAWRLQQPAEVRLY